VSADGEEVDLMGNQRMKFDVAFATRENAQVAAFSSNRGMRLLAAIQRPAGGELRLQLGLSPVTGVSRPEGAQTGYVRFDKVMVVGDSVAITFGTGSTALRGAG
jgi:hypothetical protein